ncbi:MAG: alpha/beta fold hydrolase [Thermomicrobiales bacterium]
MTFDSHGATCSADLYRPDGRSEPIPCLVMGHGFSGTKGLLRVYAEPFAAAGLAVLAIDYRHFGVSAGEPRQIVDVRKQREDYHAAVRFARSLSGVDPERIAIWGTSLSGGHVNAVAAEDPRIAAVVAQVPMFDARRTGRSLGLRMRRAFTRTALSLFLAAGRDGLHAVMHRSPYYARVVGEPGEAAVFTNADARAAFAALGGERAGWRNAFAPRFLFGLPRYRSGSEERLRMPILVCVADQDLEASPTLAVEVAKRAPRGEVRHYSAGHFDVYVEPLRSQVIADQIAFLHQHLLVPDR